MRLDRREILKALFAASSAVASNPIGLARAEALSDKTIIVIGAGCAGLGAGAQLRREGANVIVLEARDRIGGRVHTDWSMGAPFEVGAGWIHGPSKENPTKQLCDSIGSSYFLTDDDNAVTFSAEGDEWSDERLTEVAEKLYEHLEEIEEELEVWDDRTFVDVIRDLKPSLLRDPDMVWALSAYVEFSAGAPIEDLSAVTFMQTDAYPGSDVIVTSGYDKMLTPLTEGIDLRLKTPVTEIAYTDDGVTVQTPSGTIEGDYCICSVPLGVLKSGNIVFIPPLPEDVQDSIDEIGFNSVTKIAFKFEEPFWDVETQYFGIATESKGRWNYWLNYRTFSDENILLGVSVGAYAPIADAMSDAEITADALNVLSDVWGEDEVSEPIEMLRTNWSQDPYAMGTYAYPRPGTRPSTFDDLADPIGGRLFFCGEHTFFDHVGTTHGAYLSGVRSAKHVLKKAT